MTDRVRVTLTPPQITLSPASPQTTLRVGLEHDGASVDQITLTIEGIDPSWAAIPPPIPLLPGDTLFVPISIQLPPAALAQTRLLPIVVRARSAADGSLAGSAAATVTIAAVGAAPPTPPAAASVKKRVAAGVAAAVGVLAVGLLAFIFWPRGGNRPPLVSGTVPPVAAPPATGAPDPAEARVLEARYDGVHLCAPPVPVAPAPTATATALPATAPAPRPTQRPTARPTRGPSAPEGLGGSGASGPYFAQAGPAWSSDEYDHGTRQNIGCGTTIANCGCAMASVATVMSLYGVAIAPNGAELNPREFNDYLNRNARLTQSGWVSDGYVFGSVIWSSANQFTAAAAGVRPDTPAVRFRGTGTGTPEEVRAELRAGRPVVLGVPGHWIAAVGLDGDRILINDPFYRDRTTLDAYTGRVLESRLYESSGRMGAMAVTVPADQRAEVRDPRGRVIGTFQGLTPRDAIAQARRQIPNASIFYDEAIRDPNCINRPPPPNAGTITIYIPDPIPGDYQVGVQNPAGGATTVAVHGYDGTGKVTVTTEEGRGAIRFEYRYDPDAAATPTVTTTPSGTSAPPPVDTPTIVPETSTPAPTNTPAPVTPGIATPSRGTPPAVTPLPPTPRSQPTTPPTPIFTASPSPAPTQGTPPPPLSTPTPTPGGLILPTPTVTITASPTSRPTEPARAATPTPTVPPSPTATRTPSPTPTAAACPSYTDLLLTGALTSPGPSQPIVTLSWRTTGGCPPFAGTLTARYTDVNQPFEQIAVSGSEGIGNSRPTPRTCLVPTTYVVQYTLELRDGSAASRRQETRVGIPCAPPATPTPPPCLPIRDASIAAMPGPPTTTLPVTITWGANDGCAPYQGTITGGYVDQGANSDQLAVTTSKGLVTRGLPRRTCTVTTTYRVSYRIQISDASGASGTATSAFDVPCIPPPSHRFTGIIKYDNGRFPAPGTVVEARLYDSDSLGASCGDGKVAANGAYTLVVLSAGERAGCGSNGQFIHFFVGGDPASPQAPFQSGGNSTQDLALP